VNTSLGRGDYVGHNEIHHNGRAPAAGARFRTMLNKYLCQKCFQEWLSTGKEPDPVFEPDMDEERVRW